MASLPLFLSTFLDFYIFSSAKYAIDWFMNDGASGIFNILFIVGLSSVITPVPYEAHFLVDAAIAFAAAMILWVPCILNKSIYRITGIVMLVAYCGYFAYLLAVG